MSPQFLTMWVSRPAFPKTVCGSRSSVKWFAKVFLEIFIFCHLFVKCIKILFTSYNVLGVLHCAAKLIEILTTRCHDLHWLPMQARVNVKMSLSMFRVHTNSSPFYVFSLVTSCSSLQSRRALRSSSQADFVVTRSLRTVLPNLFSTPAPALPLLGFSP